MQDFIQIDQNSLDEIVTNTMVLFRHNDLGSKIETTINREIKKETETVAPNAPLQLRLRLHNRFNMDLNNVYAIELIPSTNDTIVETSVNVYHDDFNQENFEKLILEVFSDVLRDVDFDFLVRRFGLNFKNTLLHWKAAKDKQFIIDPQVDKQKQMFDRYHGFLELMKKQAKPLLKVKVRQHLAFDGHIILEKRKMSYAKSKILKIRHCGSGAIFNTTTTHGQLLSALLLEYCLVPLFLANELYVMSLIYKRNLDEIRTVLRRRIQEA